MDWRIKALVQGLLSALPWGETLNHLLQRHVTRTLPYNDALFRDAVAAAKEHVGAVRAHGAAPLPEAVFYEFGAGWQLIGPLTFHALGARAQIVIDVQRLLRPPLIAHALGQFARLGAELGIPSPPDAPPPTVEVLKRRFGIDYRAPRDARATGLPGASVDYVTSTSTMEHVPPADLPRILAECRRLLKPGGLMSFIINYQDHYAMFDPAITPWNFLKYSDAAWARHNPRLHYQNRLRHRDYLRLARESGLELVAESRTGGTAADAAAVRALRLAARFRDDDPAELSVRTSHLILRKSETRNPKLE